MYLMLYASGWMLLWQISAGQGMTALSETARV